MRLCAVILHVNSCGPGLVAILYRFEILVHVGIVEATVRLVSEQNQVTSHIA